MLGEIELYVYDKYIKELVVEENGVQKISEDDIEKLKLSPPEKNFIMYILSKQKVKVIEEKITRTDRSPYVRDNNFGDIQANDLQKIDEPVMSRFEYSPTGEKIFEDYKELDEYLETRFIPSYVLLKKIKNADGETESFPSIRLHHIMALKLSEAELEHVMNYLNERNIRVGGKGATLDNEFDNYDYVTTYKETALPLSVPANVTLQKIELYKQHNDQKLREEIITENMRLVPYVAYKYAISTSINQHELESYGYEGLILALEKFDVSYECAFSTYAVAYIRGYILRGIQEIMQGKSDNFYYDYVNAKLAVEKKCGITLAEEPELIEDVIDLLVATGKIKGNDKAKDYARMRISSMALGNLSLNDEETVEELLADGQLVDTYDEALNTVFMDEVIVDLIRVMDTLTEREQKVLRMRFGLEDGIPKTQKEVGKEFGITGGAISNIEIKALRRLRHPYRAKAIKGYLAEFDDFDIEKYHR